MNRGPDGTGNGHRHLWRSVEELSHSEEFVRWLHREFPDGIEEAPDDGSRRDFLRVMAASLALGGLTACRERPRDELLPYAYAPDHALRAGHPLFFATALVHEGYASPVVVESHMGRPIKVEGNPEHPESRGATDVFSQAAVLRLYDPDRSRTVRDHDRIATWGDFAAVWRAELARLRTRRGEGLRVLTGRSCSPTFDAALQRLLADLPEARWYRHEPVDDAAAREAARRVLGSDLVLHPDFGRTRRVLSLAADFLFESPSRVRNGHGFAAARRAWQQDRGEPLRLYAVEPTPTLTGANADHRLPVRAADLPAVARRAAALLGVEGIGSEPLGRDAERWIAACVESLREHGQQSIVLAGLGASAEVHAIALAMNARLGSLGHALAARRPPDGAGADAAGGLAGLVADLESGAVETLAVLGCNPVHTAPGGLDVAAALQRVGRLSVHAGEYFDETARWCQWHLPLAHELECWQDARSPEGRVSIVQPLIEPLHQGRAPPVVLQLLATGREVDDLEMVRAHWARRAPAGGGFAAWWHQALRRGFIEDTAAPAVDATVDEEAVRALVAAAPAAVPADALEVVFRPDDTVWDGRHANNAWLQELPKPLTKLTWDNAALVAPALAAQLGLRTGDLVRLRVGGRAVEAPVQVLPGQPMGSVCVSLGYGRRGAGRVAEGAGFDAYPLRPSAHAWAAAGLAIEPTGSRQRLAHTQHHHLMEGRHHLRAGTVEEFREDAAAIAAPHHMHRLRPQGDEGLVSEHSLLPEWPYPGQQWGMAIDLSSCIGCGACTIACQAENNIPVVGKQEVLRGREMHWIRVDRYFDGPEHDPGFWFQPVPCMHCEKAPCEVVCPVGATQHSHDGLNDMIYNRCIGTRYCSNNCPYKVRRFNFLAYTKGEPPLVALRHNPEVTVRSRGVMEKCTYCVQRIRKAGAEARREDRPIRDGEVRTACQAVCPAHAIAFGDVADPDTEVSRWKTAPHGYGMLAELNTQPRTTYLAAIRNPDPAVQRPPDARGGGTPEPR